MVLEVWTTPSLIPNMTDEFMQKIPDVNLTLMHYGSWKYNVFSERYI